MHIQEIHCRILVESLANLSDSRSPHNHSMNTYLVVDCKNTSNQRPRLPVLLVVERVKAAVVMERVKGVVVTAAAEAMVRAVVVTAAAAAEEMVVEVTVRMHNHMRHVHPNKIPDMLCSPHDPHDPKVENSRLADNHLCKCMEPVIHNH